MVLAQAQYARLAACSVVRAICLGKVEAGESEGLMPAGRPTKYDPAFCERVIELGKQGKSQVQIAVALEIPRATLHRWGEEHEEFRAALTRAKECEQDWWENAGQIGLIADKFNAQVWTKSMQARFRDDYTERREQTLTGHLTVTHEAALDELE